MDRQLDRRIDRFWIDRYMDRLIDEDTIREIDR